MKLVNKNDLESGKIYEHSKSKHGGYFDDPSNDRNERNNERKNRNNRNNNHGVFLHHVRNNIDNNNNNIGNRLSTLIDDPYNTDTAMKHMLSSGGGIGAVQATLRCINDTM